MSAVATKNADSAERVRLARATAVEGSMLAAVMQRMLAQEDIDDGALAVACAAIAMRLEELCSVAMSALDDDRETTASLQARYDGPAVTRMRASEERSQ